MALILEFGGKKPRIHESVFVAPNATIIGDVEIGEDSSVWFNAVLRGDVNLISIGKNCNVQDNSVIHPGLQETIIRDCVTISHGSVLEGCEIGGKSLIGLRSVVMRGAKIGEKCMIGAGAVVLDEQRIPDNSVAVGVPAEVIKGMDEPHLRYIEHAWREYRDRSRRYIKLFNGL
ncbi:MAG: gamma carbonic anhydrase family protein [Candidatus Geothermarchaeales archaeon]